MAFPSSGFAKTGFGFSLRGRIRRLSQFGDPQLLVISRDAQEDERTIILAKANMLIYLSDLLAEYHTRAHLKAFSGGALNTVFTLLRSNLGTFSRVDDEPYDLILTNPPYVTSGSSTLRKAIDTQGLSAHYALSGHGTEAFAVEWIVNNLKKDGEALMIVPDGLLQQHSALSFLKSQCVIYAVISLPPCTFYSTRKKTYILVLKKRVRRAERKPCRCLPTS